MRYSFNLSVAASYVSKDDPPFLIVHGTAAPQVPIDQATSFFELQKKVGMKTASLKWKAAGTSFSAMKISSAYVPSSTASFLAKMFYSPMHRFN